MTTSVWSGRFGALLRAHRIAASLTQDELAEQARLSLRGVQDLERGARRRPQPGTARRLADALGLEAAARSEFLSAGRDSASATDETAPDAPMPSSLPAELTSFVGREMECTELGRLVRANRLVTLIGPAGVGKTRLALHVTRNSGNPDCEVGWVDLASLGDPSLVPNLLATSLGIREQHGRPPTQTLADTLRPRHMMVVLDNCEHLTEVCADLADNLLASCPSLRILATSREPLRAAGELVWSVAPLACNPREQLSGPELAQLAAVTLFIDRARLRRPGFELSNRNADVILNIVQKLDGIPLAIELAAARVAVLAPEQILARLDDALHFLAGCERSNPRHQTLRAALDRSYDLLSAQEQRFFRYLAVFAGDFDIDAAEYLAAHEELDRLEVLAMLSGLIDKSLVHVSSNDEIAHYRLLEPVRQYSAALLSSCGQAQSMRQRHARYFLALAEDMSQQLDGPAPAPALLRLESNLLNFRAALVHTRSADPETALRLITALGGFWSKNGRMLEGAKAVEQALQLSQAG